MRGFSPVTTDGEDGTELTQQTSPSLQLASVSWDQAERGVNATGHANHKKKEPHGLRIVAEAKPVSAIMIYLELMIVVSVGLLVAGLLMACNDQLERYSRYSGVGVRDRSCENAKVLFTAIGGPSVFVHGVLKFLWVHCGCFATLNYLRSMESTGENEKTSGTSPGEALTQYVDHMKEAALRVDIRVECSHTETRTRTVHTTDSNGHRHSHQETYTVTITSFSHSYDFTQACKTLDHTPFNGLDVSTVVDIARDSSQLYVEFDSKQTLSQSPTAAAYLNEWKDKLYNANKHRDSRCNAWVHLTTPSVNVVKEQMVRYGSVDPFMTSSKFWVYFVLNLTCVYVYRFERRTQTCILHFKMLADLVDGNFKPQFEGNEEGLIGLLAVSDTKHAAATDEAPGTGNPGEAGPNDDYYMQKAAEMMRGQNEPS